MNLAPQFLLIYIVAAFGFAAVLGNSELTQPARNLIDTLGGNDKEMGAAPGAVTRWGFRWLLKLIECYMCTGFWTGFFFALLKFTESSIEFAIMWGFFTSATNVLVAALVNKLEN